LPVQQPSPYSTGSQPAVYLTPQQPIPVGPLPTAPPPMAPPPVAPAPVIPPMAPAATVQPIVPPIQREPMSPVRDPLSRDMFTSDPLAPPVYGNAAPSSVPPASMPPGSVQPASMPPGSVPPGSLGAGPLTPPPPPGMAPLAPLAPLPTRRPTSHAAPAEPVRELDLNLGREPAGGFGFNSGAHRVVGSNTGTHGLLGPESLSPRVSSSHQTPAPIPVPPFEDPLTSTGGFSALNGLREPEPPQIDMSPPPATSWSLASSEDPLLTGTAERRRITAIPRLGDGARDRSRDLETTGAHGLDDLPQRVPSRASEPVSRSGIELPRQREGRVTPPWQADDLPTEPPGLRLVEPAPLPDPALSADRPYADSSYSDELSGEYRFEPPALRLVEPNRSAGGTGSLRGRRSAEHSIEDTPLPADTGGSDDGDLLIFAAARSAWFTDYDSEQVGESAELNWGANDVGWRAAERASQPTITEETTSGLPRRVPQQNLVPGSPISAPEEERPLRIVRDAASIAAHTTGYFRGWRRGQEVGGYSVGGRPGRESAGGWDFSRDTGARDYEDREFEYRSARR
jgi:hypothetical protein